MALRRIVIGLAAAFAEEDDVDGFEEDADLKEGGHVLNVKKVVLEFFNRISKQAPLNPEGD